MTVAEPATRVLPVEDPYVGLAHFTEEYADFFFGREAESSLIIGNLRAARLTLLYAQSGVGKSSVLRAGVVARMREVADRDLESRGSPRLAPIVFSSWSERPVAGLVHAIAEAIRPYLGEASPPELPEDDLEAALEAASEALGATLLVILDQFEEYFLYPDEEPDAKRIAAQLATCVNRPDLRANFLISIREDAYAELGDLFRGRVKNVYGNFLHLDFLGPAGAREAIERPIRRLNELQPDAESFAVEPALVEAVLEQVGHDEADDQIETTYLQLVMRRLWEEETEAGSRTLRLATLERLGGARAIIGSHLDRAMEGVGEAGEGLSAEQRRIAAAAFRFLVTSGGTKIALTAADLADLTGFSTAEIQPVLRHLSSPRLHILRPVVFDQTGSEPRYEIFHDALAEPIREWRIRAEEEERAARRQRERAEKEEAQRAAAAAERAADRERQRKRVAQALLALAVVALLAGAAVFAVGQSKRAEQRDRDSQSVQAAERISELAWAPSFGPTAAALASVEAYGLSQTDEARERTLAQLQLNPGLPEVIAGHTDGVESVAFWPGSDKLVSGGGDETVWIWNGRGEKLSRLVADNGVEEVAVSGARADGSHLIAAGLVVGQIDLWEVSRGGEVRKLPRSGPWLLETSGVAFDPTDPTRLAVGGFEGAVSLLEIGKTGDLQVRDTRMVPGSVEDLAFASDGGALFVASWRGGVRFGLTGRAFGRRTVISRRGQFATATAPDGSYAFGGQGGFSLWPAGEKSMRMNLPGRVNALAFAEGGSVVVSAGSDWNVTTWDVKSGRPFGPPRSTNRAPVNDVAVSSAGDIAAGGEDHLIKAWPLEPSRTLATTMGALSPDEVGFGVAKFFDLAGAGPHRMATAAGQAGTLIWRLPSWGGTERIPDPIRLPGKSFAVAAHKATLVTGDRDSFVVYGEGDECEGRRYYCRLAVPSAPHSEEPVSNLVFAHHGGRVLLASSGEREGKGVVNLWDLTDVTEGGEVEHLASMEAKSSVFGVALDREQPIVAAATQNGELLAWDISDPEHPQPIEVNSREHQPLYALAFVDDGSLLASGGQGNQIVLWRVDEESGGLTVTRLPGAMLQRESIKALTFSPDGRTLAAADEEGNVCLYEVEDRHQVGDRSCLRGYNTRPVWKGGAEATKFGRIDGTTLLFTAGRGQPLVAWHSELWNLNDGDAVDRAIGNDVCRLAGRNMRSYEWGAVFAGTDLADDRHSTCPQYPLP